ncbi:MAG: DUF1329 domain-containing protein [Deltaproteobacteria bacterium]|nr:DUF1329 domain-containing protein [Deltaproteobacteria bacterium]
MALLAAAGAARADEPLTVNAANLDTYRALLPESVAARVATRQYTLRVAPVDAARFRANYSDRFWQATRANQGRFGIDAATSGLTDVATGAIPTQFFGLPFPDIDPQDPQAGTKIVHNYRARRMQMDGELHRFDLSDVLENGEVLRTVKILLSQRYYVGTSAPPPAALPDNTESRQLAAALAPQDLEGVGVLTWRFNDWTTWDKVWAFLPTIRRVRQVRSSTRGDRIPGFEVQGDDADCYDNKTTYFTWRLLGAGEVIGPVGSDTPYPRELRDEPPSRRTMALPYNNAVFETPGAKGAGWFTLGNVYVRRPVWMVEGTPKDPYYEAGRVVLYVDRDLYHGYYKLSYNKAGELYRTNFCGSAWGRSASGDFAAATALLMLGVNEKENRGTPAGRFTLQTFERGFPDDWFTAEHLGRLSVEPAR